jgi:hypothetical protein
MGNTRSEEYRHDINNHLLALKAYLELSKEMLGDASKMSEYIIREERVANAIECQIIYTKEYQDLGVMAPGWQRVDTSISKALNILPLRDVRIAAELNDLEVYADPLLEKVLYSLIDNALRYGGQGISLISPVNPIRGWLFLSRMTVPESPQRTRGVTSNTVSGTIPASGCSSPVRLSRSPESRFGRPENLAKGRGSTCSCRRVGTGPVQ